MYRPENIHIVEESGVSPPPCVSALSTFTFYQRAPNPGKFIHNPFTLIVLGLLQLNETPSPDWWKQKISA